MTRLESFFSSTSNKDGWVLHAALVESLTELLVGGKGGAGGGGILFGPPGVGGCSTVRPPLPSGTRPKLDPEGVATTAVQPTLSRSVVPE
eukprot:CAMPEP_0196601224 /NCGR_PEP_ID=MMETSP1081-20130531/95799_1 /TAXON_ID=36882 /ORGANISM="Pyramimonas amylifera, Strain CCMP720" /LENGTH=89 /DNA_ID=CAMNT_0041927093 /DNA_START=76 /DNA_END=345 /DNA_ORIENTATION=+